MTDDQMLAATIDLEGGFVNDPDDRGAATNMGITQATLSEYRHKAATVDDVKSLTRAEAVAIYRNRYLEGPGIDHIPDDRLRHLLFDSAVQHGPGTAIKFLQRAMNIPDDGILGPLTLHALASGTAEEAYKAVWAERARYYAKIIKDDPTQRRFAGGWFVRLSEFA